jgi:hypothetical protein
MRKLCLYICHYFTSIIIICDLQDMKEGITGTHFWKVVNRWKMYSFLVATNNNASTLFQNWQKRSLLCMNCGTFQTLETGYLLWLCIPMEDSVLSFLKAEWKVSDSGSAHWASS